MNRIKTIGSVLILVGDDGDGMLFARPPSRAYTTRLMIHRRCC
ncbi:hypothetical protein [Caenispirillum salinarum]